MGISETPAVWMDREPTLDEELLAMGDEDVLEMANLGEKDTGVPGVIMISTVMGRHGPRVKYFARPGRHQPSFSVAVASEPRVVARSEDFDEKTFVRMAPLVMAWVARNQEALNRFWWSGNDLMNDEVQAFIAALEKI
ncbi:MAG: hypothetical protein KJ676_12495 [Alphaproteobacteria bacterium]|nr:hypothetical protein [Alphaproteobacteria bacterium]MBU1525116.1 hypothetical protein [Alphaproteobacteria bacterium]MBU2116133.1 hypothetical protein [Alphaproteobacteria bacterium]MBU2351298.1 hypothetical protein [Alphaproteobacteria bacterium]MBU2382384.1 hypothetical protein [Alphaproteobacteria bacterium]